jgi:MFS superfamily sulfate permease-like transporter
MSEEPDRAQPERLGRFAPGLATLLSYRRGDLPHDVAAGLSVAAVAIPVGVAYAELAGFEPVVGLYASILPLVAYAVFGTSRQLIIGPDAATCAMTAAAVAPLAGGDPRLYASLTIVLTFIAGLFCIGASFLRLGGLADFLSKPILVGYLAGVALAIVLGQIGKVTGLTIEAGGIAPRLLELLRKLPLIHWPTLAVGVGAFVLLMLAPRVFPRVPAALLTLIVSGAVVALLGLDQMGVAVVGEVPSGLPSLRLPMVPLDKLGLLMAQAAAVALVSFTSGIVTTRAFASKNHYDIDVDREFAALGAAQLAASVSQGFPVAGADSRTAASDAAGGRTQVTGLVAAAAITLVLLRFVQVAARPDVELLGAQAGVHGFHDLRHYPQAQAPPGLVLLRFDGPLAFFNAPYFRDRVLAAVDAAGTGLRAVVIDATGFSTREDTTAVFMLVEFRDELASRGVELALAGKRHLIEEWRRQRGFVSDSVEGGPGLRLFSTLEDAVDALAPRRSGMTRQARVGVDGAAGVRGDHAAGRAPRRARRTTAKRAKTLSRSSVGLIPQRSTRPPYLELPPTSARRRPRCRTR